MQIKPLLWITVLLAISMPLAAQTEAEVFAPFVSRLQGELRNNMVRLSWVDSPDIRGPVYIYRSTFPFDSANIVTGTRPTEIRYGAQSFVDEIELGEIAGGTSLYYFVVASDETGRRYEIPIAAANTISVRVSTGGGAFNALTRTSTTSGFLMGDDEGFESPASGGISSIQAAVRGDRVIITFNQGAFRNTVLYRSIRPVKVTQDLLGAVIIQTKVTSPYTDYPVAGIPYYYAAVGEDEIVLGTVEIFPGRNATVTPVEVALPGGSSRPEAAADIRPMPLPELSGYFSGEEISPPVVLSPEAELALSGIRSAEAPELKTPRVFTKDLEAAPAGGEDYALGMVVKGPFSSRNWEAARDELIRFLSLPRSPDVNARARFYLGQCWYFIRQPREGLFEFLAIQDNYPAEAMEWIQASLDMLNAGS